MPVNFLIPFEGTPLAKEWNLTPQRALRILAMVRFVCPDVEVRLAGGREVHLRTMQPLALHLVNSIFLGDYLTSEGQAGQADLDMIADAGFEVEGAGTSTLPTHRSEAAESAGGCGSKGAGASLCGSSASASSDPSAPADGAGCGSACGGCSGHAGHEAPVPAQAEAGEVRSGLVAVRRRGAGTDLAPNA